MYPTKEPSPMEQKGASEMMQVVNNMTLNGEALVTALSRDHRTLQQNFTRLMVGWIQYLAKLEEGEYDLRNEASVKLAKQLVQTPNWDNLHYLPYI